MDRRGSVGGEMYRPKGDLCGSAASSISKAVAGPKLLLINCDDNAFSLLTGLHVLGRSICLFGVIEGLITQTSAPSVVDMDARLNHCAKGGCANIDDQSRHSGREYS